MVNAFNNYSLQLIWEGGWLSHEERPRDLVCAVGESRLRGDVAEPCPNQHPQHGMGSLLKWC